MPRGCLRFLMTKTKQNREPVAIKKFSYTRQSRMQSCPAIRTIFFMFVESLELNAGYFFKGSKASANALPICAKIFALPK